MKKMEIDSETENEILRDLASLQLSKLESSADENLFSGEDTYKEHTEPLSWNNLSTREARELIVAEEILRFATIIDRPVISVSTQAIQATRESTSDDILSSATIKTDIATEQGFNSKESGREDTPPVTQVTSGTIHIASEAGISGLQPPLVAAYYPIDGSTIPIDSQQITHPYQLPVFRRNTIPVTNRILDAISQNELERSASNSPVIQQTTSNDDMNRFWPRNNGQLFDSYFRDHFIFFQGSYLSRPSSPDIQGPTRSFSPKSSPSTNHSNNEISLLNQNMLLSSEVEEMATKNLQNIKGKPGVETLGGDIAQVSTQEEHEVVNIDVNKVNQKETIPQNGISQVHREEVPYGLGYDVVLDNQPFVRNRNRNNSQYFEGDLNRADASRENVGAQYPDEDESSGLEWTRVEKRRLGVVIRDLSRAIKTKKLQQKKARLLKKGRIIAQAIENKICDIDREIKAVNRKTLRQVAFPLDEIQEYDWVKIASALNAKRTPEECRTQWKCFLHPSINNGNWSQVEVRAMEIIAQRHNFHNWDDIAEELNTGRSGYQCYRIFSKNVCPHLELRGQCNHE